MSTLIASFWRHSLTALAFPTMRNRGGVDRGRPIIVRVAAHFFVLAATLSSPLESADAKCPEANSTLATGTGIALTEADVEEAGGNALLRVRTEEYERKRAILLGLINRTLLQGEATRRGTTIEALLTSEVDSQVKALTEDQLRAAYQALNGADLDSAQATAMQERLRQQKLRARREEFLGQLRREARVQIHLPAPRTTIQSGDGPSLGPPDAPVTIVVFEDFQCPYCAQLAQALRQLQTRFPDRVHIVHRDFPLPIHASAIGAAHAARCVAEQNRFWELHRLLLSNQQQLSNEDIERYASSSGANMDLFRTCQTSRRHEARIAADREYGSRVGVTSTPTMFINGRWVAGAKPYDALIDIVEEELRTNSVAEVN